MTAETDTELTLVKADTQSQALNHIIKSAYAVRVASAMDVLEYMQQGGVVEDALAGKPGNGTLDPADNPEAGAEEGADPEGGEADAQGE